MNISRIFILRPIATSLLMVAILIAGGFFFFRTLGNKDALTVKNAAVGETRSIGMTDATVVSWRRVGGQIQATVKMATRSNTLPPTKADRGWTMVVGVQLLPVPPDGLATGEASCSQTTYAAGTPAECVLAFADAKGRPFLAYAADDRQVQWALV